MGTTGKPCEPLMLKVMSHHSEGGRGLPWETQFGKSAPLCVGLHTGLLTLILSASARFKVLTYQRALSNFPLLNASVELCWCPSFTLLELISQGKAIPTARYGFHQHALW